jgi:predicted alpha/beta-hydrolase family hydrolase
MPRLQACFAAVVERVRDEIQPGILLMGGRSMGGRAATMLAAEGYPCDGLLLLAYPLHPAGQPEKLRSAHLEKIPVPVLCLNGTRDSLCRRDLMDEVVARLPKTWTMHWLEGADHGFHVLKSAGRSDAQVMAEVAEASRVWVGSLGRKPRGRDTGA